jgi:D-3-phosphoglycerate dehydrogenase / 2-oxoglutarate reductase
MKLLITTYLDKNYLPVLEEMFDTIEIAGMMQTGRVLNEQELIQAGSDADCILVEFDPITRKVLENCSNLKVIASVRGGARANIDVDAANEMKIPILNVPGRNQDTVADFTLGLMLAVSRGIAKGHFEIKNRVITDNQDFSHNGFSPSDINWVGSTPEKFAYLQFKGPTLSGKRLGLIGYGAIGRETAKRALAFDMEIVAFDPFVDPALINQNITLVDLNELMETSDFISIHVPITKDTIGMIDADLLSLMKSNAYLINTARAVVIDYDKLIDMLQENQIAGAALDVFPIEPLPDNHPLLELDNVVLTPHIGGCSIDPYERSYRKLSEDLKRFLAGERPKRIYNPEALK